jgi:hypothetical protein
MDAPDWTKPITLLEGAIISTQDFPDWTTAIVAVEGPITGGGGSTDPTLVTGAQAQTFDRYRAGGAEVRPPASDLYLTLIWLAAGTTINSITFMSGTVPATSPLHQWFGLYDVSGNQLALTTDDTSTAWPAATLKTLNIDQIASGHSTTYVTTATGAYYIGVMVNESGAMSWLGLGQASATIAQFTPVVAGLSDTAQSTRPAFPHVATAVTSASGGLWAYVS